MATVYSIQSPQTGKQTSTVEFSLIEVFMLFSPVMWCTSFLHYLPFKSVAYSTEAEVHRLQPHGGRLWCSCGSEKSHFILPHLRKDTLYRPLRTPNILQLPISHHGDKCDQMWSLWFPLLM